MRRPDFRIICCLCRKPIPRRSDAYALDAEWKRRHPEMVGNLACHDCALGPRFEWVCYARGTDEKYVRGHIRRPEPENDMDHWSHVGRNGTHVAMVMQELESGMVQGAEQYIRYTATRKGVHPDMARKLQDFLARWDARQAMPIKPPWPIS